MKTFYLVIHNAELYDNPVCINSEHITAFVKCGDNCIIRTVDGNSYKTVESYSEIIDFLQNYLSL